jgi:Sec7-like guanine-nucleotide exchange factor
MCNHLHLAGETQMVDRILFQFSSRYWECNQQFQVKYRNIDIVYGILFSIVLLNTDLHNVNFGANSIKKMSLKIFQMNTMSLVDNMLEKEPALNIKPDKHKEDIKKWKKELESLLKVSLIYFRHSIIQSKHPQ